MVQYSETTKGDDSYKKVLEVVRQGATKEQVKLLPPRPSSPSNGPAVEQNKSDGEERGQPRHGHYRFYEVKAIVKVIIGPKNWPSQWSRQLFFSKKISSQLLGKLFGQIIGQVNCQVNYVIKKILKSIVKSII